MAVVGDLDGGVVGGYVEAVGVFAGDVECLAETAGASGEEFGFGVGREAAEVGHGLDAVDGGDGADEDSACFAGEMGGCVDAVVHAVDEVDVGSAGWAEEGEVIGGEAAVEGGEAGGAFIFEDAGEDSEGGAQDCVGAAGVDLQAGFDDVEGVDDGGGYQAGGEAGDAGGIC